MIKRSEPSVEVILRNELRYFFASAVVAVGVVGLVLFGRLVVVYLRKPSNAPYFLGHSSVQFSPIGILSSASVLSLKLLTKRVTVTHD